MFLKRNHNLGLGAGLGLALALWAPGLRAEPPVAAVSPLPAFGCEEVFVQPAIEARPRFRVPIQPSQVRSLEDVRSIKLATYNLQDAHLGPEVLGREGFPARNRSGKAYKKLRAVLGVAQTLAAMQADIIVLQEVSSQSVLRFLSDHALKGEYHALLVPANDHRGFEIGFLIRRDLPFQVHYESHQDMSMLTRDGFEPVFSRDAPALEFRPIGQSENVTPSFVLVGVHQKSMRPAPGDPDGSIHRRGQVDATLKILADYDRRYRRPVRSIVAGDFNADLRKARELTPLFSRLRDVFDLAPDGPAKENRATQFYFARGSFPDFHQFDGILVSPGLQRGILHAEVFPYMNDLGEVEANPQSFRERRALPSDHRPVVAEIQL